MELHYVARPIFSRPGSFAGSGGGRALSTHARQAGLSDQPWAVRASAAAAAASRAHLLAHRPRVPASIALRRRGATLLQHGQCIRPRSPTGRRGNALCSEQAQASQMRQQKHDVPGTLVTGDVPKIEAPKSSRRVRHSSSSCERVVRSELGRDVSQEVLRPRRSAEQQEQPRALQVRQARHSLQELPSLAQWFPRLRPDVFVVPNGDPTRQEATLRRRLVATPHFLSKLIDAGRFGAANGMMDPRLADVGGNSGLTLDDGARNSVTAATLALAS